MKHDYQSYKRATSVSLLGLALQLLMGLTMLIYSFVTRPPDAVALTGGVFILLGSIVWLLLAIVFDQHRRERIEQMEIEAMGASGVRDASAFSEGADDLRVAHKRLVWMHRILVPSASLLYALLLGLLGTWTFLQGRAFLKLDAFHSTSNFGVVISLSLAVAFIGFVFARYVAGMAKQPVWAHLRAGAGVAVGASIFGLTVAITQLIDKLGPSEPIQYLHVIWPAIMVVLAVEVVLSFLMGMYSPRKPGEFPRPALDSKILSFAAAPDRIAASIGEALNYQFGFDVTGNWFYQLITRSAIGLFLVGVVVVWLLSCIAIVQPNEQGLRVRMGSKIGTALNPGAYAKLPWPFERIETYQATIARRINLGGDEPKIVGSKAILWTNDHGIAESFFAVRPAEDDLKVKIDEDGAHGSGFALAAVEIPVYYAVTDYDKFDALASPVPTEDGNSDQREEFLRSLGRKEAFTLLATKTIDEVLGSGREEISRVLRQRIEKVFAEKNAGVQILFVGIEGVHPPREASAAFEDIVRAHQRKAGNKESAQKDANASLIKVAGSVSLADQIVVAIDELQKITSDKGGSASSPEAVAKQRAIEDLLVKAGGSAAEAITTARAERWGKHMSARAQAEAYVGQIAGFKAAPEVYIARTYFDTLAEALKDARIYIIADDGHTHITTNLEDVNTSGTLLLKKKDE
jgi:modulator of FtsH protease HflK